MSSIGLAAYKLSFELSPIILNHGLAEQIPGAMLPIIAITQAISFATGLLSGSDASDLDNYFAHFKPASGATLIDNAIGNYPFANQRVAANAIISQPLKISMIMDCPARGNLAYYTKLATMVALQTTLAQHSALGGSYIVITPTFFYTNLILTRLVDISNGDSKQPQIKWQFDFAQPLLTEEQAAQAQNSLMSKLTSGAKIGGQPTWSGLSTAVGSPQSLATSSLVPAAGGQFGPTISSVLNASPPGPVSTGGFNFGPEFSR